MLKLPVAVPLLFCALPCQGQCVEEQARFPGDWNEYVATHLQYPEGVQGDVQGRVYIQFIVRKDGVITDVKVLRSLAPAFDAEALKLVYSMPCWLPAKRNGVLVDSYYVMPLVFQPGD